jgi:hypothetical protein
MKIMVESQRIERCSSALQTDAMTTLAQTPLLVAGEGLEPSLRSNLELPGYKPGVLAAELTCLN